MMTIMLMTIMLMMVAVAERVAKVSTANSRGANETRAGKKASAAFLFLKAGDQHRLGLKQEERPQLQVQAGSERGHALIGSRQL